jgi:hypothetical protein
MGFFKRSMLLDTKRNLWKWILCGVVLAAGGAGRAQTFEVSPFAAYLRMGRAPLGSASPESPQDTDSRLKSAMGYGVRLTWNPWNYYGHEITYIRLRPTFQSTLRDTDHPDGVVESDKINLQEAAYNFMMYFMPRGERWRPYFTAGMQLYQYSEPRITDFPSGSTRHYGGNYGFGLKLKLMKNALVRLDVRDYIGGKPYDLTFKDVMKSGGMMHQFEGSFGIGITF